jgi:hypothetical protein
MRRCVTLGGSSRRRGELPSQRQLLRQASGKLLASDTATGVRILVEPLDEGEALTWSTETT